jgi:flavorubredoxin
MNDNKQDYDRPIEIAEKIYWIGFYDKEADLLCNPNLIIDNDEAVIIDSGSRPDFPAVMMKVLQSGISPGNISTLIYQHYDPDVCGNIPNFEDIIDRKDLKIITENNNILFIRHYSVASPIESIQVLNFELVLRSGRKLKFITTPYAHSAGSFITFDEKSGVLFTSDIFGSYGIDWNLFFGLEDECSECNNYDKCPKKKKHCPLPGITRFHQMFMTSEKSLKFALERIMKIPCKIIAPQHGSIINKPRDMKLVTDMLYNLKEIGIDRIMG